MLQTTEYLVIARRGTDRREAHVPVYEAPRTRFPIPPEHLFRTGRGVTLCGLTVDETWERFPAQQGRLSAEACETCRSAREAAEN